MKTIHNSNSEFQLTLEEKIIIPSFNTKFNCVLSKVDIILDEEKNIKAQIDGYDETKKILVEIYSGTGKLKPGQINKVLKDAFKLVSVEKILFPDTGCEKHIVFVDEELITQFRSNSWYSLGIKEIGIELTHIKISEDDFEKLKNTKDIQGKKFKN